MSEQINWRQEGIKAAITFLIYVGGEFALTGTNAVNDWQGWALGVVLAGTRLVVSQVVTSLAASGMGRKVL